MSNNLAGKILEAVLCLPHPSRFSVEFGAWDGLYLLNARSLICDHGHRAVLIEADETRFQQLRRNYPDEERVECLKALVGWEPGNGLDHLLRATRCPTKPDFLSIDVDGNDYHIWKAVSAYRPSVVCIEFNPTIPQDVEFV